MVNLVSISQALLVAEHLSFSRAAQALGIRQSAVSRRVRALEDKLGVSLFERDANGIRLTEAGRRFLDRSRSALAEIDHAVKAAANAGRGAEGAIRIGILSLLSGGFVRELVRTYRETHPAIAIDIVEGSASEHLTRISERLLDIAFVTGTPSMPLRYHRPVGGSRLRCPAGAASPRRRRQSRLGGADGRALHRQPRCAWPGNP